MAVVTDDKSVRTKAKRRKLMHNKLVPRFSFPRKVQELWNKWLSNYYCRRLMASKFSTSPTEPSVREASTIYLLLRMVYVLGNRRLATYLHHFSVLLVVWMPPNPRLSREKG